ncbi:MAG TPA: YihY/virulence factor BrkB family protein [Bradyrhizobium sp.]|nr:YihY/virulence factor BrkB family protein [Bradyrhizobium sp.]
MISWRSLASLLRDGLFRIPGLRVVVLALKGYIVHQSANQAGSVAFSTILAMFPLLILVSAAAGFLGKPGDAAALAARVVGYTPPVVQQALQPVVDQVLSQRNQALLAIGFFVTIWTASSGVQAIRTALNKAYGIEAGLTFWKARIKVTIFTIVVGAASIAAFSSVVIMPYVWQFLENTVGVGAEAWWLRGGVRYGMAFVVLTAMYALLYGLLPDIPQTFRGVLPGALFGAALWIGLASLLSYTWRSAAELLLVYGGFAGLVATLVFLYLSTVTLILGAEVNAVLRSEKHPDVGDQGRLC